MINKIDFAAKNLTSNASLFLLFENAKANGIFKLIDTDLAYVSCFEDHQNCKICGHEAPGKIFI
jgi:hypothetical protein